MPDHPFKLAKIPVGPRWRRARVADGGSPGQVPGMEQLAYAIGAWREAARRNLAEVEQVDRQSGAAKRHRGRIASDCVEITARIDRLERFLAGNNPGAALHEAAALGEACALFRRAAAVQLRRDRAKAAAARVDEERVRLLQALAEELFPLTAGLMLTRGEIRRLLDVFGQRYPRYADEAVLLADARRLGILQ